MSRLRTAAFVACLVTGATLTSSSPALAGAPAPETAVYLGGSVGVHLRLDSWDLHESLKLIDDASVASPMLMIRAGFQPLWFLAVEVSVGTTLYTSELDDLNVALNYDLDVLFFLTKSTWQPFVDIGFGGYHNVAGDHGADFDVEWHWGLGVRGHLTDTVAFRADVRHIMTDTYDRDVAFSNNLAILVGVDGIIGRTEIETGPADRDKDAVLDADDACPDTPGTVELKGCPDADGDGDGVLDSQDKCPKVAGAAALSGCPDADGDGISDATDKCPKVAGTAKLDGCPDRDGDGVADSVDKCPDVAGSPAHAGCPDADNDGLADKEDKCPHKAGPRALQGCPPKSFDGAIAGVGFAYRTADVSSRSAKVLDQAVATMKKHPNLHVRIVGHTDSKGIREKNEALSLSRADAVKDYLVSKGIDASRIKTEGKGARSPVASNKKAAGRAKNRRIEFHVVAR